jgi:hypothetical protein
MVQYPSRHLSIYLSGSLERFFFTPKFCDAARVPNQISLNFFGGGWSGVGVQFCDVKYESKNFKHTSIFLATLWNLEYVQFFPKYYD